MSYFEPFSLPAPAKVNLFLHIVGRRPDGYHELQSAMQFLDFCDIIHFSCSTKNTLEAPAHCGPLQHNLIWRALEALQPFAKQMFPVAIRVEKKLPIGGGLGGGSSDAATTLVALNNLWKCGFSIPELQEIALALGADVPFFVGGLAAWVSGIGEKLIPHTFTESHILLVIPPCHSDTRTMYQHPELTRDTQSRRIGTLDVEKARNDFEAVARAHVPAIRDALNWLAQFGRPRMSGSGACVFLVCQDFAEATLVHAKLPGHLEGRVTCMLNKSPLRLSPNWGVAKW